MKGAPRILVVGILVVVAVGVTVVILHDRDSRSVSPVADPVQPDTAVDAGQDRAAPSQPAVSQNTAVPAKGPLRQPEKRVVPSGVGIVQPGAAENAPQVPRPAPTVPVREGGTPRLPIQQHIDGLDLTADQKARIAEFDAQFQPAAAERLRTGDAAVLAATAGMREAYSTKNREQMDQSRMTMMQAVQKKMETLEALSREYFAGIRSLLTAEQVASAEEYLKQPQVHGAEVPVPLVGSGPADPDSPDRHVREVIPLQGQQQPKKPDGDTQQ